MKTLQRGLAAVILAGLVAFTATAQEIKTEKPRSKWKFHPRWLRS